MIAISSLVNQAFNLAASRKAPWTFAYFAWRRLRRGRKEKLGAFRPWDQVPRVLDMVMFRAEESLQVEPRTADDQILTMAAVMSVLWQLLMCKTRL